MGINRDRLEKLRNLRKTKSKREFNILQNNFPERLTILSQGDSWFAYPHKNIIGKAPNIISVLSGWLHRKSNFYTMASNGDEAVNMISGSKKHKLIDQVRWHLEYKKRKPIDLILFSGAGNDIAGSNDFERFIFKYNKTFKKPEDCINKERLSRKIKQIGLAYHELLDIRDHYSSNTYVMTHTYDYPIPSLKGAKFLGGVIKTNGWMKRFMVKAKIPDTFQKDILKYFMKSWAEEVLDIEKTRERFIVVDTRNTLTSKKQWINEMHPNKDGFKLISRKMFDEIVKLFPLHNL